MKNMLIGLAFLAGFVILWYSIKITFWFIWWILAPKKWYLHNARTWSGKYGPRFVIGFFRRYGEAKAIVFLMKEVQDRLKKIHTQIRIGGDTSELYKTVEQFNILMNNSISALRAMGLASIVFPALESLVRLFRYAEPTELKIREEQRLELEIGDFSGDVSLGSSEHIMKNPATDTFEQILKELRVRN